MFYALGYDDKIGTMRECFFVNQVSVNHLVEYGKKLPLWLVGMIY